MKVKDDKNLKHLAGRASKTPETISSIIIDYCPKWDILIMILFISVKLSENV